MPASATPEVVAMGTGSCNILSSGKRQRAQANVPTDGLCLEMQAISESSPVKLPRQVTLRKSPTAGLTSNSLPGSFFSQPRLSASQSSLYSAFATPQRSQNKLTHTHHGGQAFLNHSLTHSLLRTPHLFVHSVILPLSPYHPKLDPSK